MPHDESFYPEDWLRIAEKDLGRVEKLLGLDDPEAAGFFLQQAVEKFLKALLLSSGWKLQRVHDLEVLLNAAITYDASFGTFREVCQKVSGFYFVERYPFVVETGITAEVVRGSLLEVIGLVGLVRSSVFCNHSK
jgi:HEPN domain-containing protein